MVYEFDQISKRGFFEVVCFCSYALLYDGDCPFVCFEVLHASACASFRSAVRYGGAESGL